MGHHHQSTSSSQLTRRWFLPVGLFSNLCIAMIPLKESIASREFSIAHLQCLQLHTNPWWSNVKTLFYTGRFTQAFSLCEEKFPIIIEKPVAAARKIMSLSRSGKYETMDIISDILCKCNHQYEAALQLLHYMTDRGI